MDYYVVDAFTSELFAGNPAGVCVLDGPADPTLMQAIAAENNLSETAFTWPLPNNTYSLRWFTPNSEVDLCGHATLGTAFVLSTFIDPDADTFRFTTMTSGELSVTRKADVFTLDFPARAPYEIARTGELENLVDVDAEEMYGSVRDLLLVVGSEEEVRRCTPNLPAIAALTEYQGVIVTAKGDEVDFVSRFFAPLLDVDEDPVTGSAHCVLTPFWSERLGKTTFSAKQLSLRGGDLLCQLNGDRVSISGKAILYLKGSIEIPRYAQ